MNKMNIAEISKEIFDKINEADAIVIGIGSGLTSEGGISFDSKDLVEEWFPEYSNLGFFSIKELLRQYKWFNKKNVTEYWSFWGPFIQKLRYSTPVLKPYSDLYEILKDKNYFIITSTYDGQVIKAGFNPDRVFTPDGDLAYLQCSLPCTYDIYYNEKEVSKLVNHISHEDKARADLIPLCPICGEYLIPNVRTDENFTAEPYLQNIRDYDNFLDSNLNNRVLFMELGEGYENPMIIRYPFENMTVKIENSHLIRFNTTEYEVPNDIEDKTTVVNTNISEVLEEIKNLK